MNENRTKSAPVVLLLTVLSVFSASAGSAQPLEVDLLKQYTQIMKIVDSLEVYNQQQEGLIASQESEMAVVMESTENVTSVARQLPALLEVMVANLEKFVELDVPFRVSERQGEVEMLKEMMERPDIAVSEKFIRVMEAYEKETQYGDSYESYSDVILLEGKKRQVDVLRFGRVSLSFQTPDLVVTGVWNNRARQWEILSDEYRKDVRLAIRIASNTMTPDLVGLPVATPEKR